MNKSHDVANALRIALLLAGVVALLAAASVARAASSGGVGQVPDGPSAQTSKYDRLWDRVSLKDKRWASSTAMCESGKNPKAIGGGGKYRGAFQFLKSTWAAAPKSPGGDPIDYSYRTQAVVAIALKNRDGAGHWPNCG